jgi:hypothetical protein
MPRVKRKGHLKRDAEAPLPEWSLAELRTELERLEANPEDLTPWGCFKRKSELGNELYRRGINA